VECDGLPTLSEREQAPALHVTSLDENFVAAARLRQADAAVIVQPPQALGDL
jgi:hypothetical protein